MNKKLEAKIKLEEKIGEFFIERFNKFYNSDYKIYSNKEDDSDVDIFARSKTLEELRIQIKTGEGELKEFYGRASTLIKKIKSVMGNVFFGPIMSEPFGGNIFEKYKKIIKDSENKYLATAPDLILLISEEIIFYPFDKIFAKKLSQECGNSKFMGIYIVGMPSATHTSAPHDGQIVAIKDIGNNHG